MGMWRHRIKDQRGQALVEFAIVLPIMLLVLFGMVEFGRIFYTQLAVNNAAREGARWAAVHAFTTADALKTKVGENAYVLDTNTVKNGTSFVYLDSNRVEQDLNDPNDRTRGGSIKISVSYPVDIFLPIPTLLDNDPYDGRNNTRWVKAFVTMRVE